MIEREIKQSIESLFRSNKKKKKRKIYSTDAISWQSIFFSPKPATE